MVVATFVVVAVAAVATFVVEVEVVATFVVEVEVAATFVVGVGVVATIAVEVGVRVKARVRRGQWEPIADAFGVHLHIEPFDAQVAVVVVRDVSCDGVSEVVVLAQELCLVGCRLDLPIFSFHISFE